MNEPNKELQDLEEQLRALEHKDDDFEDFYAGILAEFGEKTPNEEDYLKGLMKEKPKAARPAPVNTNTYADKQRKAAPVKKDHSIRNLSIVIVLELLGIGGVIAWWILRLL